MTVNDYIELGLAALGIVNGYFLLLIKMSLSESRLKLAQLELAIEKRFISKDDFSEWTRASSFLPTYTKDRGSRERA